MNDHVMVFDSIDDFWKWINVTPQKQVNISHSFVAKNRCRSCGKHPTQYYCATMPGYFSNPRVQFDVLNWTKNMRYLLMLDFYLLARPKDCTAAGIFGVRPTHQKFKPRLHMTKDTRHHIMVDYVICECGKSVWTFADANVVTPEKINRSGRYQYPQKFRYD